MTDIARQLGLEPRRVAGKWGWFVALGVVMVLLGGFALGDTMLVTLLSVIFIGAALLVGGVFQIIHAFANKQWGAFLLALLCGALYVAGGLLIMDEPVNGSVIITICVTVALAINGVLRIVMALRHRELQGWWLMLLGGLIAIGVAVLLYMSLPWSSLWLLGTLIAVELIFNGVGWIRLGFALRAEG
ncbi:MAG TPA: HdeD family acid-resistance protein [Stellaceae bacterium]|nr:HdeD family acid-resistance protein [Stellaceae bacterium]